MLLMVTCLTRMVGWLNWVNCSRSAAQLVSGEGQCVRCHIAHGCQGRPQDEGDASDGKEFQHGLAVVVCGAGTGQGVKHEVIIGHQGHQGRGCVPPVRLARRAYRIFQRWF